MVTIYLPVSIKKKDMNKKEYIIIKDENTFLSRYLNVLKKFGNFLSNKVNIKYKLF